MSDVRDTGLDVPLADKARLPHHVRQAANARTARDYAQYKKDWDYHVSFHENPPHMLHKLATLVELTMLVRHQQPSGNYDLQAIWTQATIEYFTGKAISLPNLQPLLCEVYGW